MAFAIEFIWPTFLKIAKLLFGNSRDEMCNSRSCYLYMFRNQNSQNKVGLMQHVLKNCFSKDIYLISKGYQEKHSTTCIVSATCAWILDKAQFHTL